MLSPNYAGLDGGQNRDDYYVDDIARTNWHLHFNEEGNTLIGRILAEFMNTQ